MVILAPLASRWGYTLVHMEYINVMLVVNSTKQWLLKLSNCVSLSLLSMVGLIRASGGWPGLRAAWGGRDGIESVIHLRYNFELGFMWDTKLRKFHLEKALLSHSDPRAPPALPFAWVPFACGRARPVCETLLIAANNEMVHL